MLRCPLRFSLSTMNRVRIGIVDCQGFRSSAKNFLFKELAVVSLDGRIIQNYIFEAPFDLWTSKSADPRNVNWVTENHHLLKWSEGEVPYRFLPVILEKVNVTFKKIYVKGSEKCTWLEPYKAADVELTNLEEEFPQCPSLKELKSDRSCIFEHRNCALTNAFKVQEWLITSKSLEPE